MTFPRRWERASRKAPIQDSLTSSSGHSHDPSSYSPRYTCLILLNSRSIGINSPRSRGDAVCRSIFLGDLELSRALWANCEKPVHAALAGVAICRLIVAAGYPSSVNHSEIARQLELWATGVIISITDERRAHSILSLRMCRGQSVAAVRSTAIDLAMFAHCKHFLKQTHCNSLIQFWWQGGDASPTSPHIVLEAGFSYLSIMIYALLPILNPYIWLAQETPPRLIAKKYEVRIARGK